MAFLLSFEGLRAFTGKNSPLVSLKNKASTPSVHKFYAPLLWPVKRLYYG